MTVSAEYQPHSYKPGAAMAPEAIPFEFIDPGYLIVTRVSAADGSRTTMVGGTDYVVTGDGRAAAGRITALAAWPADDDWIVARDTGLLQRAKIRAHEPVPAADFEEQLDRMAMVAQEGRALHDDLDSRAIKVVAGQSVEPLDLTAFAGKFWLGSGTGEPVPATMTDPDGVDTLATLADPAAGAALVAFKGALIGSQTRDADSKLSDTVCVFDFMTPAQIADVRAATAISDYAAAIDVTAPVQAAIDTGKSIYCPAGAYKITATVTFPNTVTVLYGDGQDSTIFQAQGITGPIFKATVPKYFRPMWWDFSIIDAVADARGASTTTYGIDVSGLDFVTGGTMFNFDIRNVRVSSGGHGLFVPACFSGKFDNVVANSNTGHAFCVAAAQSVTFINCYGSKCGDSKAAYRLAGSILLIGCNGMDVGGYWGIFGQDPAAADGFQADFPNFTVSSPDVTIIGGNVEHFVKGGIMLHYVYNSCRIIGQKWDRAALSTDYEYFLRVRKSPGAMVPIRLSLGAVFKGTGAPKGPNGTATDAYIYTDEAAFIADDSGTTAGNFGAIVSAVYGEGKVPLVSQTISADVYQNAGLSFNALGARRFRARMLMYGTVTLTPVGSNQAIDVTGYSKVIITPAAAASISTATFIATLGTGSVNDYGRNGDLVIEAGNANLTINHAASGANTFRLKGAAAATLAAGEIRCFMRSESTSQWIEV